MPPPPTGAVCDHERIKPSTKLRHPPFCLQAAGYRLVVLPVAGALLGSVLGGPLGLLAGFKAAGVAAALGGGALGFAGGRVVQKHRKAQLDLRMKQVMAPPPGDEESDKDK